MRFAKRWIGLGAILLSFCLFFLMNLPTMKEEAFSFSSTYRERPVTLQASLWEVPGAERAVLICPGYSCDRQKWRPFADLFVENGYTTMVFDYAGQGGSSSTIGFDNAKTDAIPVEIDDALEVLHERTGIPYEQMILMGHSMGGRAILRLLHDYNDPKAETTVEKKAVSDVILFSPEVNYDFNAQASLFAGTSDDVEEPWASYAEEDIQGTNVYLYGSTADDIVSDENILAIASHMGWKGLPTEGTFEGSFENQLGSRITVGITAGILHSYQMYSPEFAAYANEALTDISKTESRFPAWKMLLVYGGWGLGLIGVYLFLSSVTEKRSADSLTETGPALTDARRFLVRKLLLWIPGLVMAFVICCICVVMPFGSPVMNTPYMCAIAGYGLVMLFAYRKGTFPGTEGKLPGLFGGHVRSRRDLLYGLLAAIGVCLFVWYVLRSSMYRLIPINARLFWVAFAGVLMTIGYHVSGCEVEMLKRAHASRPVMVLYNLIQYGALFLLVLFYLVIASYSGLIGQIQNMILMYVLCIPIGTLLRQRTGNRLIGAFVTGFLFQTLMITSAALIAVF